MPNKISLRILLLGLFIIATLFAHKIINQQNEIIKNFIEENDFVGSIPKMQKEIKVLEAKEGIGAKEGAGNSKPVVSGIFIQGGVAFALVADSFLKEGEAAGSYEVRKITPHSVIIFDRSLNQEKEYRFSE